MTFWHRALQIFGIIGFTLILVACGSDEIDDDDESVTSATPNKYLVFFNRQAELAAGDYKLVVATNSAGESGSFSVLVKRNNGSDEEVLTGEWSNSAGLSATPAATCKGSPANVCFNIDMCKVLVISLKIINFLSS